MNEKTPELLPCPFCGEFHMAFAGVLGRSCRLFCAECGAAGPTCDNDAQAVERWNTRHFGRTLTNEIGASPEEAAHEAGQAVIDNEASSIKRDSEKPG